VKPWCSLGGRLTDALVTGTTDAGARQLFRVDLTQSSVTVEPALWVSRGLADVESGPLRFDRAEAVPVGEPGWYLSRPGFRWGAVGVAAAWLGGCTPLFEAMLTRARQEAASPLVVARVGSLFRALDSARILLDHAATVIDQATAAGTVDEDVAAVIAHSVRGAAADAATATLSAAQDLLGPAVFGFDESLARRAVDLQMYISQYHRGPDDVSLVSHLSGASIQW
jgi:alkylation response protein AidB-like acyl-CoA dehydrogenase